MLTNKVIEKRDITQLHQLWNSSWNCCLRYREKNKWTIFKVATPLLQQIWRVTSHVFHKTAMGWMHIVFGCRRRHTAVASSTMRALSSARCTGVRLYTLRIKIGANQRALASSRIIELASDVQNLLGAIPRRVSSKMMPNRLVQSRRLRPASWSSWSDRPH